jgi:hypothetical protein
VRWNGNAITIILQKYRFIEGCNVIAREAPDSCVRSPCPVCSLFGALIAEGMDKAVNLEQCSTSPSHEDLVMVWSIVADS